MKSIVKVGIGVFIIKDHKFLIQKRLNSHGHDTWSIPGGHIEFGESFEETTVREVKEETGLDVKNIRFGAVTNDIFESENKHYISIWTICDWASGKEKIKEPDKSKDQIWIDFDNLPKPLFFPWEQLLKSEFIDNIKKELTKS